MKIIRITDGDLNWSAIRFRSLPNSREDIATIVGILTGQHEHASELLNDVVAGSTAAALGARTFTIIAFDVAPRGGFGVGGVYGVMNWVRDRLDPAMPEGFGAAHSEPIMWPLVGNTDATEYYIERDLFALRAAEKHELPVAHCALISQMNRTTTPVIGAFLRDFEAPDGTPALLPVTI